MRESISERPPPRRRRLLWVGGVVVVVLLAAGTVLAWRSLTQRPSASPARQLSTATVARRDLTTRERVNGTLGYGDAAPLLNQRAGGIYTVLPAPGTVFSRGQTVYTVDDRPIPLLYGSRPFWRHLEKGVKGGDVAELEQNLLALGYGTASTLAADGDFTAADEAAVKRWQKDLGVPQTGAVDPGDVALAPGAIRVAELKAGLGTPAGPGSPVMTVTSTTPLVTVDLDASLQSLVRVGDHVDVTLPGSGKLVGGRVGSVASAVTPGSDASHPATVRVTVTLDGQAATGGVDQAPVQVSIVSSRASGVLAVPVTALLAAGGGGYALEVVGAGAGGRTRLLPVTVGVFDDQDGLVEVSGAGIGEGTRVVVPASI